MRLDIMCLKAAYITIACARIELTGIVLAIVIDKRREKAGAFTL